MELQYMLKTDTSVYKEFAVFEQSAAIFPTGLIQ